MHVPELLRPGILDGQAVLVVGGGEVVAARLASLGATLLEGPAERVDTLVHDGGEVFRSVAGEPLAGFRACVDGTWETVREVALQAWIPSDGGKAIFVSPRPSDGEHAAAARAALENAARTLSIEWARYGVRPTALTPGDTTTDEQIADVVAYLASPGGDYFSGARFDMGAVAL
jgi:NAD(P)-dependent dehydrogenase (short-subunit alcohol dehydrogenase family)